MEVVLEILPVVVAIIFAVMFPVWEQMFKKFVFPRLQRRRRAISRPEKEPENND